MRLDTATGDDDVEIRPAAEYLVRQLAGTDFVGACGLGGSGQAGYCAALPEARDVGLDVPDATAGRPHSRSLR